MLDKIETIRQVLVSSIEAGIPGAQTAMLELEAINYATVMLYDVKDEIYQAAQNEEAGND